MPLGMMGADTMVAGRVRNGFGVPWEVAVRLEVGFGWVWWSLGRFRVGLVVPNVKVSGWIGNGL